jgi:leucyl-tRNA synthetase
MPRPETDLAAVLEYVQSARNRSDVERQESKEKTGVFTGVSVRNPATGEKIPVWAADYVLMGYGTGAIMAVPGQDERDWEFAEAFNLPIVRTVRPPEWWDGSAYTGEGPAINSDFLNGLGIDDAKVKIIEWLEEHKAGARRVNYRLRDWLFSRQRYWGEPFPIVYDRAGRHYPVSDAALPVRLPPLDDYAPEESDEPRPLLAKAADWVKTTAGEAGVDPALLDPSEPVTRETNTMPGWAGSCWYYLRYCDAGNDDRLVSREAERYWMMTPAEGVPRELADASGTFDTQYHKIGGVDLYVGGAEHAVLHLLYARFWHKVLFDLGEVTTPEPFSKLFHQGLITSHAYQDETKRLIPIDEVDEIEEGKFILRETGAEVAQIVAKMSKSLKNVVNPDDIIEDYGADTFRLYEMYMGPLETSKPWNTRDIIGLFRFLQRAWRMIIDEATGEPRLAAKPDEAVERQLHRAIAKVKADIPDLRFNTAIAALIEFVNAAIKPGVTQDQAERFTLALAPFAPHIAEEFWSRLGGAGSLAHHPFPPHDPSMLTDDMVEIPVQIMGKVKAKIVVPADADGKAMEEAALADARVQELIAGKTVRKIITVPGRLINIVVS